MELGIGSPLGSPLNIKVSDGVAPESSAPTIVSLEGINGPVHLAGIGGIGMSALARLLLEQGHHVSGSDKAESPITDEL